MYKEILQGIDHVAVWPMISFIIFFLFFLILVWWAFTADRGYVQDMSELPLDEKENTDVQSTLL